MDVTPTDLRCSSPIRRNTEPPQLPPPDLPDDFADFDDTEIRRILRTTAIIGRFFPTREVQEDNTVRETSCATCRARIAPTMAHQRLMVGSPLIFPVDEAVLEAMRYQDLIPLEFVLQRDSNSNLAPALNIPLQPRDAHRPRLQRVPSMRAGLHEDSNKENVPQ